MRDPSRPLVRPILVLLVAASVASLPASSADADRSLAAEPPPVLPELERTVTDARRQATELLRKNMEALDDIELEAVAIFAAIVAANSTANSSASSLPLKHDHKALLLPSCSDLSFASTLCNTIVSGIISARDAAISAKNAAVTLVNNARSSFTTKVTAFKRKIDTFESFDDRERFGPPELAWGTDSLTVGVDGEAWVRRQTKAAFSADNGTASLSFDDLDPATFVPAESTLPPLVCSLADGAAALFAVFGEEVL